MKQTKCCHKETAIAERLMKKGHSSPADGVEKVLGNLEKQKSD